MAQHTTTEIAWLKMIEAEIQHQVQQQMEIAIKKAQEDIAVAIRKSVAQIVMNIMSNYSVTQFQNKIVIEVRNDV